MAQENSNYQAPQTNPPVTTKKVSVLIITIALVLTVTGVVIGFLSALSQGLGANGRTGELFGQPIGMIVLALIVVAVFQIFKRFRNQRSRWKIYCWGILYSILFSVFKLLQAVAPVAAGQALEDFELRGNYCNEVAVGSLETCLCFEFKDFGVLSSSYGRTLSDGSKSTVVEGTFERVGNIINTSLPDSEGGQRAEVLDLTTLKHIKTSDGLVFKEMVEQPALCTAGS